VIARGQVQTGHGTGFQPGEIVTGVQRSVELDLGTQTADATGEVTFTWTIRTAETLGDHTFIITGTDSGTASATFRVTAGGTLPATGADNGIVVWALAAVTLGGALVTLTVRRRTARRCLGQHP
jgi:LPXTG-motif cell wall-anchored protein